MIDVVIVVIVILLVGITIKPAVEHFKGQGGCCGGGSYRSGRKKLAHVIQKKRICIEGMHCENCGNRIMEAVNDIPDVSAKVYWKKSLAEISYAKQVDDAVIREKIEKAGYIVKEMETIE